MVASCWPLRLHPHPPVTHFLVCSIMSISCWPLHFHHFSQCYLICIIVPANLHLHHQAASCWLHWMCIIVLPVIGIYIAGCIASALSHHQLLATLHLHYRTTNCRRCTCTITAGQLLASYIFLASLGHPSSFVHFICIIITTNCWRHHSS